MEYFDNTLPNQVYHFACNLCEIFVRWENRCVGLLNICMYEFSVEKQSKALPPLPPDAPIPSTKVEEKILEIAEEIDSKVFLSPSVLITLN